MSFDFGLLLDSSTARPASAPEPRTPTDSARLASKFQSSSLARQSLHHFTPRSNAILDIALLKRTPADEDMPPPRARTTAARFEAATLDIEVHPLPSPADDTYGSYERRRIETIAQDEIDPALQLLDDLVPSGGEGLAAQDEVEQRERREKRQRDGGIGEGGQNKRKQWSKVVPLTAVGPLISDGQHDNTQWEALPLSPDGDGSHCSFPADERFYDDLVPLNDASSPTRRGDTTPSSRFSVLEPFSEFPHYDKADELVRIKRETSDDAGGDIRRWEECTDEEWRAGGQALVAKFAALIQRVQELIV